MVDVDADAPENASVNPELEEGEFIEVFLTPFQGLHKTLVVSLFTSVHCLACAHRTRNWIELVHFLETSALHIVWSI